MPRRIAHNETISGNILRAGESNSLKGLGLQPLSMASAALRSRPAAALGTFSADQDGNIRAAINIPDQTVPGFYILTLTGKNVAGEEIIFQKTVYVAASVSDIDADGVANAEEACLAVPASGKDSDRDGVDDACDAFISKPPLVVSGQSFIPLQAERKANKNEGELVPQPYVSSHNPGGSTLGEGSDPAKSASMSLKNKAVDTENDDRAVWLLILAMELLPLLATIAVAIWWYRIGERKDK